MMSERKYTAQLPSALLRNLTLEQLAAAPQVRALVEQEEAKIRKERQALAKALAALDSEENRQKTAAARARQEAADKGLDAARSALQAAQIEQMHAASALSEVTTPIDAQRRQIAKQLREIADPRIDMFHGKVSELLWDGTRFLAATVPVVTHNWVLGRKTTRYISNLDEVTALRERLREFVAAAEAMKLAPLSVDEVTAQLGDWCVEISARLREFGIPGLRVTPDDVTDLVAEH